MLHVFFFFYVIFALVHLLQGYVCKLKCFIDFANISLRTSRFFSLLVAKKTINIMQTSKKTPTQSISYDFLTLWCLSQCNLIHVMYAGFSIRTGTWRLPGCSDKIAGSNFVLQKKKLRAEKKIYRTKKLFWLK
jgi:hypothetical protein